MSRKFTNGANTFGSTRDRLHLCNRFDLFDYWIRSGTLDRCLAACADLLLCGSTRAAVLAFEPDVSAISMVSLRHGLSARGPIGAG